MFHTKYGNDYAPGPPGISTKTKRPGCAAATAWAICGSARRISFHLFLLRTTTESLRPSRLCWNGRLVSVVSNTSNPAASAARSNCPLRKGAPALFGSGSHCVLAQELTDTHGCTLIKQNKHLGVLQGRREALCSEVQDSFNLLLCQAIEHFDDLVYCQTVFEVFEHGSDGDACATKNPCPTHLPRDTLHGCTL